jgi:hypothetical protein
MLFWAEVPVVLPGVLPSLLMSMGVMNMGQVFPKVGLIAPFAGS